MATANKPLYQQPLNPLYAVAPSIKDFCQPTCGANAMDLRFTDMDSINGLRMTKGAKSVHRIPATVKPCSGYVNESRRGVNQTPSYSKKEMRSLAMKVLRDRGIAVNEKTIRGILSGKTL